MWHLRNIEVNGGFLPGLRLDFPPGLTCIIGPRGSGKSTLAELIRFTLCGPIGATKARLDLLQANLGSGGLVTVHAHTLAGVDYIVRRSFKQQPIVTTADGRTLESVDLDRGTFLPLDAYSFADIESIADETLGHKRRALLDDLRSSDLHGIQLALSDHRRTLDANADLIRSQRRSIADLTERIEELGDARALLLALGPQPEGHSTNAYAVATRQQQLNDSEQRRLDRALSTLAALRSDLERSSASLASETLIDLVELGSSNASVIRDAEQTTRDLLKLNQAAIDSILNSLREAVDTLHALKTRLDSLHLHHSAELANLSKQNEAAGAAVRERAALERKVAQYEQLEQERASALQVLQQLLLDRTAAKARYLSEREEVSVLRQRVAEDLQAETGPNIRIRVMRHADDFAYRQSLLDGLKGARVRNHDDLLRSLLTLRPEQLAQLIEANDVTAFNDLLAFGTERSTKVLDALRENIDPLELEVTPIEDRVRIELNVATGSSTNFKDAAELSHGQKCTALLPLLLARRHTPLIIDQPEDNLDNHFIFETVVDSINRLKLQRQMVFITHNANIPVLAEADLVVVMNSDGKIGYVEKSGSIDQCRDEIIDLLEGGRRAFDLRAQRYARA